MLFSHSFNQIHKGIKCTMLIEQYVSLRMLLYYFTTETTSAQLYNCNNNNFSLICHTNSVLFYWFAFFVLFAQTVEPLRQTRARTKQGQYINWNTTVISRGACKGTCTGWTGNAMDQQFKGCMQKLKIAVGLVAFSSLIVLMLNIFTRGKKKYLHIRGSETTENLSDSDQNRSRSAGESKWNK